VDGFDPQTPNLARMYDYMLGGVDNYAADREASDLLAELIPQTVPLARINRGFLQRSVRHLANAGVRQFLDLGSGLPTQGSVHQLVPGAKVVYVDRDPAVAAHAAALLREEHKDGTCGPEFLCADLLATGEVLERAGAFLDLTRPVGVLLISVLHVIPDSDGPHEAVAALRRALAPGSHLVLTHSIAPGRYGASAPGRGAARPPARIRDFFGGFTLVEPGLVHAADWRPDRPRLAGEPATTSCLMAGVGWKGPEIDSQV
jgi:SAM-dependent methyltransferase